MKHQKIITFVVPNFQSEIYNAFFNMKPIISPVDREILKRELSEDKFLRPTNKAHNEIYVITAHNAPNVMREIGRLREISFRSGGGGTGEELDTDEYDYMEKPYNQLIVWDPLAEEIIGGYRYLPGIDVDFDEDGQPKFVMAHLFTFTEKFIQDFIPYTIELGRAFVQPDYQTSKMGTKSLFALDNLWDGLGALMLTVKNARYFIGKVTIYEHYPLIARELIYEYMHRYFPDPDGMISPKNPIHVSDKTNQLAKELFVHNDSAADYKALQKAIRVEGETIPSMFSAYIGLTHTMRFFGSIYDPDFGSVYETGIMITMSDLLEVKRKRYIEPYVEYLKIVIEERKIAKKAAREKKLAEKIAKKQNKTERKSKRKKDQAI
ncbi:MAG: GNAT family N-acetyltransferase [Paludibacter sp.]|nr:GNAT family N-acetyltransferase [Paludibacter sp.]